MTSLVLWCGPVSPDALAGIHWQSPTTVVTFGQGIAGVAPDGQFSSNAFNNLANWAKQQTPSGDLLDGLLTSRGLPLAATWDRIAVVAFSAGHALMNRLLLEDSGKILAAVALDACYSDNNALAKPGYVSFGSLAAKRSRLMVFTAGAGGGGPSFSTGSQCARANFNAVVGFTRVPAVVLPASAISTIPAPAGDKGAMWARAGDLFLLDYGSQLDHKAHVWQLAKPIVEAFLVPYLGTGGHLPPSLSVSATPPSGLFPDTGVPEAIPQPNDPDVIPEEELPVPATPFFTTGRVLTGLAFLTAGVLGVYGVRKAMAEERMRSGESRGLVFRGPGWYVLGYEVSERVPKKKLHDADVKQWDGPFDSEAKAEAHAEKLRREGWREDARAEVSYRDKSPWRG